MNPRLRHVQCARLTVLGPPRVGIVGRRPRRHERRQLDALPVDLPVADEVGATVTEAVGEQRLPVAPRAGRTQQCVPRVRVPVDGRDLEVVPGGPVEVDHDRLPAEPRRDRRRDRLEQVLELALPADEVRELEQRAQPRKRGGSRAVFRDATRRGWCAVRIEHSSAAVSAPRKKGRRPRFGAGRLSIGAAPSRSYRSKRGKSLVRARSAGRAKSSSRSCGRRMAVVHG